MKLRTVKKEKVDLLKIKLLSRFLCKPKTRSD